MLRGQGVSAKSAAERTRLIKKIVILLLVVMVSVLFCVWSRVRVVQMGYEISGLQKEEVELSKKMNHLKLEVERLKSPARLQKVASKILKMHQPTSEDIVFVKKEN
jgi:cell division protein FtsL